MSQEKIFKTLAELGLTKVDAKVYVFLAKRGPKKAGDIAKSLKISKQQLYPSIKSLQSKAIVNSTITHPARFSAVPFERTLDLFAQAKLKEAESIQQNKTELLSDWQSVVVKEAEDNSAKFTVIEGRKYVYSKIQQMVNDTKQQLSTVTSLPSLMRAYQYGILESAFNHPLKSKVKFRFIADLTEDNFNTLKKLLEKAPKTRFNLKGRNPELGLKLSPRMVIKDNQELLFFTSPQSEEYSCLWTNCEELVNSFSVVFEDLWRNSTDIERNISLISSKNRKSKTQNAGAKAICRKFENILQLAREEIICLTTPEAIKNIVKKAKILKSGKGTIKILASITQQNLEVIKQLPKNVQVRHVPETYIETFVIDGKHLFQFKSPINIKNPTIRPALDPFYSDDVQYVNKMKKRLNDIWRDACEPSSSTIESIMEQYGFIVRSSFPPLRKLKGFNVFMEDAGEISEKDILNKIINSNQQTANTSNEFGKMYGTSATAIIHPPEHIELPDIMIWVDHIDKKSWFGQGDALVISLKIETANGLLFVPAGGIGDNPQGVMHRKENYFPDKKAQEYYRLVKKDELQVRVHGNTLFAGWTVPIPLFPKYVLPPACVIIEGYGEIKTRASTIIAPSGCKSESQSNYLDAFVTFLHPAAKYSGPGTEGLFFRDIVSTIFMPKK
jgi:sugar-specific transcriptional regulator TrmB